MTNYKERYRQKEIGRVGDWAAEVYKDLCGDLRERVLQADTEPISVSRPHIWTPFGMTLKKISMIGTFITSHDTHVAFGVAQHRVFRWDITDPKFLLAIKHGQNDEQRYFFEKVDGVVIADHIAYNNGPTTHLVRLNEDITKIPELLRALNMLDRQLPPAK